jgi:hypothetical protein
MLQRRNRGVEVAMLLLQARQLRPKLAFFLLCHRRLGRAVMALGPRLVGPWAPFRPVSGSGLSRFG